MGERSGPAEPAGRVFQVTRREFMRASAAGVVAAPALLGALTACREVTASNGPASGLAPGARANGAGVLHEVRRVARPADVDLGPLGTKRIWVYDDRFPGPEIRVREGDRLRVQLRNELAEETTIHWHGVPVPNAMDGVPGVTQAAVEPGTSFTYEFTAGPAGTYLYHSHQGLQLDRGLLGTLVVEELSPPAIDREYTLVLDDLLPGEPPDPLGAIDERTGGSPGSATGSGARSMMRGMGRMGGMGNGMDVPRYEAFLVNGRPPDDPAVLQVRKGERVRLRLANPSGATTFQVAVAAHRMTVTHTDGRPVRPVEVDAVLIGMGERYDVVVEADAPGSWAVVAVPLQGGAPARAVLSYDGAREGTPPIEQVPEGLRGGRVLALDDLEALEPLLPDAAPDRRFDLVLSGGMMSPYWTIDGQAYPEADPLEIRAGERVRVRMRNASMGLHPMHLHGHFFQVGRTWKDTVMVPPHMGEVTFDFVADNPGPWFFHCHNAYHMEAGMARIVRYV